jgi:TPR repeat protein
MELNGYGGERDPAAAVDLLERAANAGVTDAMLLLGNAYREGVGTAASPWAAGFWHLRAAALEHPQATQALTHPHSSSALNSAQTDR